MRRIMRGLRGILGYACSSPRAFIAAGITCAMAMSAVLPAGSEELTAEAYAAHVGGKLIEPGKLVIDNQSLYCGRRPTVLDPNLDDYGAAFPGFVILNPNLLARVSTPVKLWIYAHECAHQFRGPDEAIADCFAVQRGRRQGWLTTRGLDQVCAFITPARGSVMHPPGPERCRLMRQCFAERRVR
ncbi:MAG: hypothetical protein AAGG99_01590 [Pseudomonadota bacterium]